MLLAKRKIKYEESEFWIVAFAYCNWRINVVSWNEQIISWVDGIAGMLAGKGLPEFIAYGVYVGEVIAPLLIVLGYRTRLASVVFVINMLVIVFVAHANDIFALSPHGGLKLELTALYLVGALVLFFTGAGKFAVSHHNKWD